MGNAYNQQPAYHTLNDIRLRKEELLKGIRSDQKEMGKLWNEMVHPKRQAKQKGVTLSGVISSSVGILDGALFAWKLYRRFKR